MMNPHGPVVVTRHAGVATVTLSRGDSLNLLNAAMLAALESAFLELRGDADVHCIIITGEGRAFSAGADLREMRQMLHADAYSYSRRGQTVVGLLEAMEVPTIAQLNGITLGGGFELALATTFRIASDAAIIGLPELSLGLIPGFGGTQRLPRLIGMQAARRLILGSEKVDAETACRIGLIDQVVAPFELSRAGMELAERLSLASAPALRAAKRSMQAALEGKVVEGFDLEAVEFSSIFATEERAEGLSAFFEKRQPAFRSQ